MQEDQDGCLGAGAADPGVFDLVPMLQRHAGLRFLELGRSCVLPPYRDKRTIELLWHGIWSYARRHHIGAMLGCASFPGSNAEEHRLALSYLKHHAAAPEEWQVRALPERRATYSAMPAEAIALREAMRKLPPLIKGYLRVGAFVGEDAVADHEFGTTDVLVVMPVAQISARYIAYFGPGAERHAA